MKKILLSMMACAALCACTSDDALVDNTVNGLVEDGVYMKFNISLADVTRSTTTSGDTDDYGTSSSGQEYGQTEENAVSKVSIVLADATGTTVYAKADLSDLDKVGTDTYVACFEDTEIKEAAGKDVNVFVYCNQKVETYSKDAYYTLEDEDDTTPWTDGAFYMSNAVAHQVELPADLSSYSSKGNPLDLGVVRVERSVARFDYKDGVPVTEGSAPFTYPLWYDANGGLLASVVLEEAAVINMSNSFYTLRRTAADNKGVADYENPTLLGVETAKNWVIDTDAAEKLNGTSTGFVYGMESPSTWDWATLAELNKDDDNDTWDSGNEQNYYIWRYVTENTIPSIDGQIHGNTTGIVFKAELKDETEGTKLFDGVHRVYVYEQVAYANWDAVAEAAATAGENSSLHDAYLEVMDVWNKKEAGTDEYDADVTAQMSKAGFTGFSPEDGKYYMYYYYWNRHNDNGDPNNMGIMEYAVVRNNVYKLSVTDITGFGHAKPNDPDDPGFTPDPDPDPVTPDDPDETEEIWIKLDVEILPWVVRVNDIKF